MNFWIVNWLNFCSTEKTSSLRSWVGLQNNRSYNYQNHKRAPTNKCPIHLQLFFFNANISLCVPYICIQAIGEAYESISRLLAGPHPSAECSGGHLGKPLAPWHLPSSFSRKNWQGFISFCFFLTIAYHTSLLLAAPHPSGWSGYFERGDKTGARIVVFSSITPGIQVVLRKGSRGLIWKIRVARSFLQTLEGAALPIRETMDPKAH